MARLGAMLCVTVLVGVAAFNRLSPQAPSNDHLAEVTRISASPRIDDDNGDRSFSPTRALIRNEASRRDPVATKPWVAVVVADAPAPARSAAATKNDPATRAELTRDLQRELKRAGCYKGYETGSWNAATRRGMARFMESVNASLPFKDPDFILLTLVKGHSGRVCGVARTVVAQASEDQAPKRDRRRGARDVGRVPAAPVDTADTNIAKAELPWLKDDAPQVSATSRPAPLPGMMSVGAPRPNAVELPPGGDDGVKEVPGNKRVAPIVNASVDTRLPDGSDASASPGPVLDPKTGASNRKRVNIQPPPAKRPAAAVKPSISKSSWNGRRRGQPRPGTQLYYAVQSLGGIY